jgi:TctA family transporter
MLPLGVLAIKSYKQVLKMPRGVLMPVILVFCTVGAFAINNTPFDIGVMLAFGVLAFFMEASGFPVAPVILGAVLGHMLEENFTTSMIKAEGDWVSFFSRPIAGTLGVLTILVWLSPAVTAWLRRTKIAIPELPKSDHNV